MSFQEVELVQEILEYYRVMWLVDKDRILKEGSQTLQ